MEHFIKILEASDGSQVAFFRGRDLATGEHRFFGLTLGAQNQFVETVMSGTEEQTQKLFDGANESMVAAMRVQAMGF